MRTNTPSPGQSAINRDFQNVVDDAHELLKTVEVEGAAKLNQAKSQVADTYEVARAKLGEVKDAATRTGKEYVEQTDHYVHQHPWQAVGVAAAVGALIGFLASRR